MTKPTHTGIRLPQLMIGFLDNLADPVEIKTGSEILYVNMATVKLCSLKSPDQMIGKIYHEIDSPLFENKEIINEWRKQDQKIEAKEISELRTLEIHPEGAKSPYFVTKTPFYNDNQECTGTIIHGRYLELFRPNDFIKGKLPGSLLLTMPDDFFTEKECEIIFLKLQGMKSKEIADIIYRSARTVENAIQQMYAKAGVSHATDFAEFCEKRNLHRYLPKRFIDCKRFSFDTEFLGV